MAKQLLILGHVWPEPETTAAGSRMKQLLEAFKAMGYHIDFASTATRTPHSMDLDSKGISTASIELNNPSFDRFVKNLDPDFVVFDRFMVEEQFGWRVAEQLPNAIRILNTEDLHSLRKAREETHRAGEGFTVQQWMDHPMTLREVASIYRSDCSLLISSFEMELLEKNLGIPKALLLYLPFMVEGVSRETLEDWPSFEKRRDFVHIGNGRHRPNVDSIHLLKSELWPQISKSLPGAKLHVHGAYLPQEVLEMHDPKTGFLVEGWTDDLKGTLQNARVLLAPLRFGAGIKGKLLDAMLHGIPSVTTTIGTEGMKGDRPWNGAVEDDPQSFAREAVELYQNREKWEEAQSHGEGLILEHFDHRRHREALKGHLAQLERKLGVHRDQNFIGKILQQEIHSSSKYMAKWIEAKNPL